MKLYTKNKQDIEFYLMCKDMEYNQFWVWVIAIPLRLLGNGYLAFVLLTASLFLIPVMGLLALFVWKVCSKYRIGHFTYISIYLIVLSVTVPLLPVLSGYIDIVALQPLLLCVGMGQVFCFSVSMVLSLIISVMLFYSIQDMGEHHYYITVIQIVTLSIVGYGALYDLCKRIGNGICSNILEIVVVLIYILNCRKA